MLSLLNAHFSHTFFYKVQKTLLFPTINSVYKNYRSNIIDICTSRTINNFIGDGHSDSPGYSAKYGTYSLMNTDINKIVDIFVVHVSTAGNSSRMEKKGLQTLLERLNNIKFTTLTTDRHVQIRDFLHQFDVWHFGKSIKKNLSSISKKKENEKLGQWIKAIVNHLWWCCASVNGDVNILREKWLSILYHIRMPHT